MCLYRAGLGSSLQRTSLSGTLNSVNIVTAGRDKERFRDSGLVWQGTPSLGLDGRQRVQGGWGNTGVVGDPLGCRARGPESASLGRSCGRAGQGLPVDPHLFLPGRSHATEGTSLSVGKGPWKWCVFHEMEDNAGVRGTESPLVWGRNLCSPSLNRAIQGHWVGTIHFPTLLRD